eukprot:TRINITY_DN570_c0_g1_i4.p2 TRINITY_DN570_c0_g1~~TRINITY_DN570_c0_g1_i4.p2  ORF type:complete len:122 (+),score=10.44 TRINITY_DN570_c0_g1_i4:368-733(+)
MSITMHRSDGVNGISKTFTAFPQDTLDCCLCDHRPEPEPSLWLTRTRKANTYDRSRTRTFTTLGCAPHVCCSWASRTNLPAAHVLRFQQDALVQLDLTLCAVGPRLARNHLDLGGFKSNQD